MANRLAVDTDLPSVELDSITDSRVDSSHDGIMGGHGDYTHPGSLSPRGDGGDESEYRTGQPRYMTSIRNGGVGHIDLGAIGLDPMDTRLADEELRDLFDDLINEAARADFKSGIYKFLHRTTEITILTLTTVAGFMGIFDTANEGVSYAIGALCFTAAGLKSGLEMTGMYKRAITIRSVANELRSLSREAKTLLYKPGTPSERLREYDQLCTKMDEIMMKSFTTDLTIIRSPQGRGSSNERFSRVSGRVANPLPIDSVYH